MASWVEVNGAYFNKDAIDKMAVEAVGISAATEYYVVIHLRDGSSVQIGPYSSSSAAGAIVTAILTTDTVYGPYAS